MNPLVSVIIPLKNEEKTIPIALDSLVIQEVDFEFEVILADGCSTDQSLEVIKAHSLCKKAEVHILPLPENNHGMTTARNMAAATAKGTFILFMQADIRVKDVHALKKVVDAFDTVGVVATFAIGSSADSEFHNYDFWTKVMMARYLGAETPEDFSTKFNGVRADTFRNINGFDEKRFAWGGEDFDFFTRLNAQGTIKKTDIRFEHLHAIGGTTTAHILLKKLCRNSEVMGAAFTVYLKNRHLQKGIVPYLFQQCALCGAGLSCLLPWAWPWSPLFLFLAGFVWQRHAYIHIRDWRLIYLPFFSFIALILFTYYFMRGFMFRTTSVTINRKGK